MYTVVFKSLLIRKKKILAYYQIHQSNLPECNYLYHGFLVEFDWPKNSNGKLNDIEIFLLIGCDFKIKRFLSYFNLSGVSLQSVTLRIRERHFRIKNLYEQN